MLIMIWNKMRILVLLTLFTTSSGCGIFREYFVSKCLRILINIVFSSLNYDFPLKTLSLFKMQRECAIEGLKQTKLYTSCLEQQKVFLRQFLCIMTLKIMSYTNPCRDHDDPNLHESFMPLDI